MSSADRYETIAIATDGLVIDGLISKECGTLAMTSRSERQMPTTGPQRYLEYCLLAANKFGALGADNPDMARIWSLARFHGGGVSRSRFPGRLWLGQTAISVVKWRRSANRVTSQILHVALVA